MKKVNFIFVVLLAGVLFAPLVGAEGTKEKAAGKAADSDKPTFVMVPKGVHPYYEPVYEGFQAAAEQYGVNAEMVTPREFDISAQVNVIEDLIARGVDGIAISALDDAGLISVVDDAISAGIAVITFDSPAPSTAARTYIGTDNETAGYEGGRLMAEAMGGEGQLAIFQGGLGATNLNLRTQGFRAAIQEHGPNIEILPLVDVQGDFAVAANQTEALLQTYPDVRGIFGVSAEVAPAAAGVLRQQGRAGDIVLAGFDDLADTLEGIRDDTIAFCLVQRTYTMGWLSVEYLQDVLGGEDIPEVVDTGILVVTKENVDSYMEEMQQETVR